MYVNTYRDMVQGVGLFKDLAFLQLLGPLPKGFAGSPNMGKLKGSALPLPWFQHAAVMLWEQGTSETCAPPKDSVKRIQETRWIRG